MRTLLNSFSEGGVRETGKGIQGRDRQSDGERKRERERGRGGDKER